MQSLTPVSSDSDSPDSDSPDSDSPDSDSSDSDSSDSDSSDSDPSDSDPPDSDSSDSDSSDSDSPDSDSPDSDPPDSDSSDWLVLVLVLVLVLEFVSDSVESSPELVFVEWSECSVFESEGGVQARASSENRPIGRTREDSPRHGVEVTHHHGASNLVFRSEREIAHVRLGGRRAVTEAAGARVVHADLSVPVQLEGLPRDVSNWLNVFPTG